ENAAYRIDIAPDGQLDMSQATRLIVPPFDPTGLRVIASAKHRAKETDELISQLHIKQTMGASSSYKFCLLADGKADLYPRHGRTMEWDTAAGQAILQAAGGVVTTTDHAPLTYGKLDRGLDNPSFIAATATNWQDAEK
ncbi:3'(2'),5'-bisphosphate nucleotidase CysQ, partial [bacterium]|nr:3'(2'),5'-bisphosphate nucleotidase CysQ [bacterium]